MGAQGIAIEMRVLLIEDEPAVADLVGRALRDADWAVDVVATGTGALSALDSAEYDVVVLDLGLPDMDGRDVCRRWRSRGGHTPVLMLTARNALSDRIAGFDAGADDYLTKPFDVAELLARLRALTRPPGSESELLLRLDTLELDPWVRTARRGSRALALTAREYALLEYLLRNPNTIVTTSQILAHVWGDNIEPVGNLVDLLVGRVHRKVDGPGDCCLIHVAPGSGYLLSDSSLAGGA